MKKRNPAQCVAVFGTGSDVGKSVVATALCRYFLDRKLKVAPFKAQNMSNNSGITPDGCEMGRAQIVQAEAAGLSPHVDMNPILLKPTSDIGSQVVVLGEVHSQSTASDYHRQKESLFETAAGALDRLRAANDIIVMEGAGSCAEVNLMANDIVNFRMAEYGQSEVILVADIHRGGVFGQLVGTLACLPEAYRDRIKGFIVNRFRGDITLFQDGVDWIEKKTGIPVLGVLPWYDHFAIEAEDSVVLEKLPTATAIDAQLPKIIVIRIPHIANFTDFAPLTELAGLNVHYAEKVVDLSVYSAVIIPGSKNTLYDLAWLKRKGWEKALKTYADRRGHILGICGGYQMLGRHLHDPYGLDGAPGTVEGLDLLPVETTMKSPKTTSISQFTWGSVAGQGYEIHMGLTERHGGEPLFNVTRRNNRIENDDDGCVAAQGRILGTYMHGLFDCPEITGRWLTTIGLDQLKMPRRAGLAARTEAYAQLVQHFEKHMDRKKLNALKVFR